MFPSQAILRLLLILLSVEVLTHPSGVSADGNIGINLVNLEFVLSIGSLSTEGPRQVSI